MKTTAKGYTIDNYYGEPTLFTCSKQKCYNKIVDSFKKRLFCSSRYHTKKINKKCYVCSKPI